MLLDDRYLAQMTLPGFGPRGQERLQKARVVIIGIGGLGCPAAIYLAAAGIGHLSLVDGDVVENTNLHRQILFGATHLGRSKVESASLVLRDRYPDVDIAVHHSHLTESNAATLIDGYDVALDATDSMQATIVLDRVCSAFGVPLVYASVYRGMGQISVLTSATGEYRDMFLQHGVRESTACTADGVLGPVTGMLGCMMATETIKLITGMGSPRTGMLSYIDTFKNEQYDVRIRKGENLDQEQS